MKPTEAIEPPEPSPESSPKKPLTLKEQSDLIGALMLASAQRLATDEKHRREIQKLLF